MYIDSCNEKFFISKLVNVSMYDHPSDLLVFESTLCDVRNGPLLTEQHDKSPMVYYSLLFNVSITILNHSFVQKTVQYPLKNRYY